VDVIRPSGRMWRCVLHHITTVDDLTGYAQDGSLRVTS
jgi:hypothetical protein